MPINNKGWLRQKVVAKLRKRGVPIAASRDGYKIPTSKEDLATFVDFVAQKTIPYLQRVNDIEAVSFSAQVYPTICLRTNPSS